MSILILSIAGDVPSKSNSYSTTRTGGFYKKKELKDYEKSFLVQYRSLRHTMHVDGEFHAAFRVYYRERRKDLDNSFKIIFDCLQSSGIITNDRLCMTIHAEKMVDRMNPRVEIALFDDKRKFFQYINSYYEHKPDSRQDEQEVRGLH